MIVPSERLLLYQKLSELLGVQAIQGEAKYPTLEKHELRSLGLALQHNFLDLGH
jgi:hypothetical protein